MRESLLTGISVNAILTAVEQFENIKYRVRDQDRRTSRSVKQIV
jgi:hypothetical protein